VRAAILNSVGQSRLDVHDDVEIVATGPGQVKVRIRATSLCHSDLSVMNGTVARPAPIVLGHEAAGEVIEVGMGVTGVVPGQRVIICWHPQCGSCAACRRGQGNLCSASAISGSPPFRLAGQPVHAFNNSGTFAEEALISEAAAVPLPDDVPYEIGALVGCGVTTGVGAALNTAKIGPGDTVAVIGLGAVGIAAVQGALVGGASRVVGVDPVERRRQWALPFGATEAVPPEGLAGAIQRHTGGEGFDHVLEAVGSPKTVRAGFDAARRGGVLTVIGVGSPREQVPVSLYELLGEKALRGSYYGGGDILRTFRMVLDLWRSGRIDMAGMITRRADLGDINDAVEQMIAGRTLRTMISV
jgi:S-(hydroxymethyl)glutathione dehydrogenase/alcohol dehydrogenase